MSLNNFVPVVWSTKILQGLDKNHVFGAIANREYEGEIKAGGNTVKINQVGDVNVGNYTKYGSITVQQLQDAQTELKVDQQKYFAFEIDDIDKAQQNPKVIGEAMRKATYALRNTQDSYMGGLYADSGLSYYTDASPLNVTSANVEDALLGVAEEMNDHNVPMENRFIVIPPWFLTKLVLAGIVSKTDNSNMWKQGFVDYALGFDIMLSNNVSIGTASSGAQTRMIAGVKNESFALAEQIVSVEGYRPEDGFSDAVKGLHVYGSKIFRPDMTCTFYADKTAES